MWGKLVCGAGGGRDVYPVHNATRNLSGRNGGHNTIHTLTTYGIGSVKRAEGGDCRWRRTSAREKGNQGGEQSLNDAGNLAKLVEGRYVISCHGGEMDSQETEVTREEKCRGKTRRPPLEA